MKADDTTTLKSLGTSGTEYATDGPSASVLETFPNPHPDAGYHVTLTTDEVSSLCPKTGQPDFASLRIVYSPDKTCVETKSLKLYLFRYRQQGAFMENIANQIAKDLVEVLQPKKLVVQMVFAPRGGIGLVVDSVYDPAAEEAKKVLAECRRLGHEVQATVDKIRQAAETHQQTKDDQADLGGEG